MSTLTHAEARRDLHQGRRWLDNKAAAALDAHLAECAECRVYAADLAVLEPALARALHARWDGVHPPVAAPEPEDAAPQRARPRRLNPAFAFGAIALVLVLTVLLLPSLAGQPLEGTPVTGAIEGCSTSVFSLRPIVTAESSVSTRAFCGTPAHLASPNPEGLALDRALFAADYGEFTGEPPTTTVLSPPRVLAWDAISDRVLWSVETGLWPRLSVDRAGRYLFVLSQPNAGSATLAGETYDVNEASRPSDAWPVRVTMLDPATGITLQAIDLPHGFQWMNLVGAAGDMLYLYRFTTAYSLAAIDLTTGTLQSFENYRWDLCTNAYPRYVQLAPDGSAVYTFCTPNMADADWWVQITHFDQREPVIIELPQVGDVGRWGNGMVLSHDGTRLYVADSHLGILGEIDTARGEMVRTVQYKPAGRQGRYEALLTLAPNGRLLYMGSLHPAEQDRAIWAVDTSTLETVGFVHTDPVVPHALAAGALGRVIVASQQGVTGYNLPGRQQLPTSAVLPRSVQQLLPYPANVSLVASPPPIVPTGLNLLAFVRDGDIHVMYADGSGLRNLTQRPGPDRAPTWSPDGRYLAYIADRGDVADVMLLDVEAALASDDLIPPMRLMRDAANGALSDQMVWQPDGKWLAVTIQQGEGPGATGTEVLFLRVYAAVGSGIDSPSPDREIAHAAAHPRYPQDGSYRLLYLGVDEAGAPALFVQDPVTRERVNVTAADRAVPEEYWSYNFYDWSPDGKFVAYLRVGPWLGQWPDVRLSPDSHAQIVIAAPDGSAGTVVWDLAPAPDGIFGLEYSPDGRYLMFVSDQESDGCWSINVLALEGPSLIGGLGGVCYTTRTALPHWSPDSRWLVFTAGWDGVVPGDGGAREQELTALDVAQAVFTLGESPRVVPVRLTTWVGDDYSPQWQP